MLDKNKWSVPLSLLGWVVFLVIMLWVVSTPLLAQSGKKEVYLRISGGFYINGQKLSNVSVIIENDRGEVINKFISDENGRFEVVLELDKVYNLRFHKEEYVDKVVGVNTHEVSQDTRKQDYYYKGWKVEMVPVDLDLDVSVLNKPVAWVVYDVLNDDFTTDKKYERSVRPALRKLAEDLQNAYDDAYAENEFVKEDYQLAIKDGNLFLEEGDYENAIIQFEAAKELMPNESYPDKQIAKAKKMLDANKSIDERYNSYIQLADEMFNNKDWEEAKQNYLKAKDVKPKMEYPKEQLALIEENIKAEKEELERLAREERLQAYNDAIASADEAYNKAKYQEAIGYYKEALTIQPRTAYPQTKIREINALLADKAKSEKAYLNLMVTAQNFLNERKFEEAKEAYTQALDMKPDEELPKQKLAEIETMLASLAALKAEEEAFAKRKAAESQAQYNKHIASADALMADDAFEKAKLEYEAALKIKANEEYPKTQIKLINKSLLELESLEKQYTRLMVSGAKFKGSGEYERAKRDYVAAANLKPDAQEPKDAIAAIDAKLAELAAAEEAKRKALDDKYNGLVKQGDDLLASEDYTGAEAAYKSALKVKPSEEYPKKQLATIKDKLAAIAAAKAASEKEAKELAAKEAKYNNIIGRADQMLKDGNLKGAKTVYKEALEVMPAKEYPVNQIAGIDAKLEALAAEAAAKAKAEAEMAAKEKSYNELISKADAAMNAKNYTNARLTYQDAQKIFPSRPYPAKQIEKIADLELAAIKAAEEKERLAKLAEENKAKFDAVLAEGDALFDNGEWEKAKYKYQAALKLISGEVRAVKRIRQCETEIEKARKLAEFHAKNDTEFNRQLAIDYPNGLKETTTKGGKTVTRIVIVANGRGDEYRKEEYSYGAVFYFKNNKKIDAATYKRETKESD